MNEKLKHNFVASEGKFLLADLFITRNESTGEIGAYPQRYKSYEDEVGDKNIDYKTGCTHVLIGKELHFARVEEK